GTGSEAQTYALISDAESHDKMACGDPKAAFRVALLDPALTVSQPRSVTATSGYDAIAHAVETYVSRKRNALSEVFSREAWTLLVPSVVRWKGPVAAERYGELLKLSSPNLHFDNQEPAEILARRLEQLAAAGGLRTGLSAAGVTRDELVPLAADAAGQWTGS